MQSGNRTKKRLASVIEETKMFCLVLCTLRLICNEFAKCLDAGNVFSRWRGLANSLYPNFYEWNLNRAPPNNSEHWIVALRWYIVRRVAVSRTTFHIHPHATSTLPTRQLQPPPMPPDPPIYLHYLYPSLVQSSVPNPLPPPATPRPNVPLHARLPACLPDCHPLRRNLPTYLTPNPAPELQSSTTPAPIPTGLLLPPKPRTPCLVATITEQRTQLSQRCEWKYLLP